MKVIKDKRAYELCSCYESVGSFANQLVLMDARLPLSEQHEGSMIKIRLEINNYRDFTTSFVGMRVVHARFMFSQQRHAPEDICACRRLWVSEWTTVF